MTLSRREYLHRLLGPLWLRAESALWYAHEAYLARRALGDSIAGPSLEVGTMEGVSTFVMLGGEFGLDFDVYQEADATGAAQFKSLAESDYYAQRRDDAVVEIARAADEKFDVGIAYKRVHAEKVARLGIHGRVALHDANLPLDSFAGAAFRTIWAPNLYWIDNLRGLLGELARIVTSDGRIVTVLPDRRALDVMLQRTLTNAGADPAWVRAIDRGRSENIGRQARTVDEWRALFAETGLRVADHQPFLHDPVFRVNDVGLRPLFPALLDVYQTLRAHRPDDWRRIKARWIALCDEMLGPLCDTDWMERAGAGTVWHLFVLEKGS